MVADYSHKLSTCVCVCVFYHIVLMPKTWILGPLFEVWSKIIFRGGGCVTGNFEFDRDSIHPTPLLCSQTVNPYLEKKPLGTDQKR